MVSQLLFGEHFSILEENEKWAFIKNFADNYEGWVDKKQFVKISEEEYLSLCNQPQHLLFEIFKKVGKKENLVMGSVLNHYKKGKFQNAGTNFSFRGKSVLSNRKPNRNNLIKVAKMFLNSPYLWGGRTFFGIDCSGLTQIVFRLNGIQLPRDAWQQAEKGETLNFIEEARNGDLAFFDNEEGKIIHTGIIINSTISKIKNTITKKEVHSSEFGGEPGPLIIHASGMVRIDKLDHYGIFNSQTGRYSHNLRLLKKVV